ncbi:hypothetical protein QYM36_018552, partial [Artemia franciscana]
VIEAAISFISLVKQTGPREWVFNELKLIDEINFRFMEEIPPYENVESIVSYMHYYPPSDYLTGLHLIREYNPELICECLDYLKPEKMNIAILHKDFAEPGFTDKKEKWVGVNYRIEDIPKSWLDHLNSLSPRPEFRVPEPNPFLAKNFEIFIPISAEKYPEKILEEPSGTLWFRQDYIFKLPKASLGVYLISPFATNDASNAAGLDLLAMALQQDTMEELYAAHLANLEYSISAGDRGLVVKTAGFNDKLDVLLGKIFEHLITIESRITDGFFKVLVDQLKKKYKNSLLKPSSLYNVYEIMCGEKVCRSNSFNPTDPNSVSVNYYQCGISGIREAAIIEALIWIMEEPAFNQLRTQEQLGYHVSSSMLDTHGVTGFTISVYYQIFKFTPEHINERIEAFLHYFHNFLSTLTTSNYMERMTSLIKNKEKPDVSLDEEFSRNWNEILRGEFMFDRLERTVEFLRNITFDAIKDLYQKLFCFCDNEKFRKISFEVLGRQSKDESELKKGLSLTLIPFTIFFVMILEVRLLREEIIDLKKKRIEGQFLIKGKDKREEGKYKSIISKKGKQKTVYRTESEHSEDSSTKRVSFNKDISVKHIPRGAVLDKQGQVIGYLPENEGRKFVRNVYKEPLILNEDDLAEEAARILKQVENADCIVT